ncbi:hypothetical protein TVH25_00140 [Rhodococcus sp. 7Tela_A2]|uniref:hypothetical protein n=1 Tax=Rhodococcus sp. 7Tela_A2 TaxID=3093744 RepID=UPI003BB78380
MNRLLFGAVMAVILVGSVSACGAESDSPAEMVPSSGAVASTTTTSTIPETTTVKPLPATTSSTPKQTLPPVEAEPAPAAAVPAAAAEVTSVPMPPVVCMDLQSAQNLIQDLGVFYSRSVDATGKGRKQVLDANWIVVGQTPGVGVPIGEGDAVLSVVKIGEPNPC